MIAFPSMLIGPAQEAGMKVPPITDNNLEELMDKDNFKNEYPHFFIFCAVQLGTGMPHPTAHWDNAKVIAALTEEECKTVTIPELISKGLSIST